VAIVVNRHLNDRVIGVDTVEKTLGKPAFWMLPNDYVTAAAAINQGSPVVELNRGGLLAKGYEGLARRVLQEIGVEDASAAHGSRFGVLGRWVQRGRASLNGLS
jgi:Flp pilus assembly CpaE family ATPase